jgi:hypothetical protein
MKKIHLFYAKPDSFGSVCYSELPTRISVRNFLDQSETLLNAARRHHL